MWIFVCVCVCVVVCVFRGVEVTFKDVLSCEMALGSEGTAGGKPAECQYQITGRLSAGTHQTG